MEPLHGFNKDACGAAGANSHLGLAHNFRIGVLDVCKPILHIAMWIILHMKSLHGKYIAVKELLKVRYT